MSETQQEFEKLRDEFEKAIIEREKANLQGRPVDVRQERDDECKRARTALTTFASRPSPTLEGVAQVEAFERMIKHLDNLTNCTHGEECSAHGQNPDADVEDIETDIDDNPSDFLEKCDCGLKDSFEAYKIAKSLRAPASPDSPTVKECARLIGLWWTSWLKMQPNPQYYREADRIVSYFPEKLMETCKAPDSPTGTREPAILNEKHGRSHILKTHPAPFSALLAGKKPFEWRKFDRDFQVGDVLMLNEYDPERKELTGICVTRKVTYLISGCFGIPADYCIMGLAEIQPGELGASTAAPGRERWIVVYPNGTEELRKTEPFDGPARFKSAERIRVFEAKPATQTYVATNFPADTSGPLPSPRPAPQSAPGRPPLLADVTKDEWGATIIFRVGPKDLDAFECTAEEADEIAYRINYFNNQGQGNPTPTTRDDRRRPLDLGYVACATRGCEVDIPIASGVEICSMCQDAQERGRKAHATREEA